MGRSFSGCVIGLDFDNTLISYDALFYRLSLEQGMLTLPDNPGKKAIRDAIRNSPEGDLRWQQLQSLAYGPRIGEAELIEGVRTFLVQCHRARYTVYIVSHKTRLAHFGVPRPDLHEAALKWMTLNHFFDESMGLTRQNIHFGITRQEKIESIRQLGCTHFIDDLEEVFLEKSFPANVEKILYNPQYSPASLTALPNMTVFQSWPQINAHFFGVIEA